MPVLPSLASAGGAIGSAAAVLHHAGKREPVVSLLQRPPVGVALELKGELSDCAMRARDRAPQRRERDRQQHDEAVAANNVRPLVVERSVELLVVEPYQCSRRDEMRGRMSPATANSTPVPLTMRLSRGPSPRTSRSMSWRARRAL